MHDPSLISKAFERLGTELFNASGQEENELSRAIGAAYLQNPWFIPGFVRHSFLSWAEALAGEKIEKWLAMYPGLGAENKKPAVVGLIMAGNIPMVGLHDLLCVLASGNNALVKLSSQDKILMPALTDILQKISTLFVNRVQFTDSPFKDFTAIIATGSNNSSRYFDYYFGKYPHIIRKNRNSVAVLTGNESESELKLLADDVFMYFGLGCRNVSKIYLPAGYDMTELFQGFGKYSYFSDNHKYRNNYDYQKSILLVNREHHLDNGFVLVKPDVSFISPISVIHTEEYSSRENLKMQLDMNADKIQCIVASHDAFPGVVPFGMSQHPELWDYADGVDTMRFLLNL